MGLVFCVKFDLHSGYVLMFKILYVALLTIDQTPNSSILLKILGFTFISLNNMDDCHTFSLVIQGEIYSSKDGCLQEYTHIVLIQLNRTIDGLCAQHNACG